jgi:hypothetical protein
MTADWIPLKDVTMVVVCFLTQDQSIKPALEDRSHHSIVGIPIACLRMNISSTYKQKGG